MDHVLHCSSNSWLLCPAVHSVTPSNYVISAGFLLADIASFYMRYFFVSVLIAAKTSLSRIRKQRRWDVPASSIPAVGLSKQLTVHNDILFCLILLMQSNLISAERWNWERHSSLDVLHKTGIWNYFVDFINGRSFGVLPSCSEELCWSIDLSSTPYISSDNVQWNCESSFSDWIFDLCCFLWKHKRQLQGCFYCDYTVLHLIRKLKDQSLSLTKSAQKLKILCNIVIFLDYLPHL